MIVHLNITEYMGFGNERKIRTYAQAMDAAIDAGTVTGPLITTCPECGSHFNNTDEVYRDVEHIIASTTSDTFAILVACEGYFVMDPSLVGIDSPGWADYNNA